MFISSKGIGEEKTELKCKNMSIIYYCCLTKQYQTFYDK